MYAFIGDKKGDLNDDKLFMGPKEVGTKFVLKGTFKVYNAQPYATSYKGKKEHLLKGFDVEDEGNINYTFPSWEMWTVTKVWKNRPTEPYTSEGKLHTIPNIIGLTETPSPSYEENLVQLEPMTKYSLDAGIVNHQYLFSIRREHPQGRGYAFSTLYSPILVMTWKAFKESISKSIDPPPNIHLPVGTIIKIRPYQEIQEELQKDRIFNTNQYREEQDLFQVSTERKRGRWEKEYGGVNMVVTGTPYRPFMGFYSKRTTCDLFPPIYKRKTAKVRRFKARSPPFKVNHVQYSNTNEIAWGLTFRYTLATTLKNNTSALRKKSDFIPAIFKDPEMLHYCIKKGYITIEGRYAGRAEVKQKWLKAMKQATKLIKFDYLSWESDNLPDVDSLSPSF